MKRALLTGGAFLLLTTLVIRAKAGLEPALAACDERQWLNTLPGGRAGRKTPPRAEGYARNGLPAIDRSPFQAGTAHRVPINGQESFSLSGRVKGAEGTLGRLLRARAGREPALAACNEQHLRTTRSTSSIYRMVERENKT